jgi:hypothetical protein
MLARSSDGGNSWREWVISDKRFKPKPIVGGPSSYQGDHISLIANRNKLHAFWMDDRTGLYQIWSAVIELSLVGAAEEAPSKPFGFQIFQNYPNPFNPSTTIEYSVASEQFVELSVYDLLGRKVAVLVNGTQPAGLHSIHFDASSLSSSVYFYELRSGTAKLTKKLLYLK